MASPQSTLPNDEKEAQDSAHNPDDLAYKEGLGAGVGAGIDQLESFANDPENHDGSDDVKDGEENPSWKSSYGGNVSKAGRQLTSANVIAILKKRGPLGLIAILGVGGGLVGTLLFSPAILLVQMKESLTDNFNTQLFSMESRTAKIINYKVSGSTTGICGAKISIKCKYATISEKQAARLKSAGIDVEGSTKFGKRIKPTSYVFEGKTLSASEFNAQRTTNPNLKTALNKAYNPKYAGFSDRVWTKVATRLGITKQRALPDGDDATKSTAVNEDTKNGKKFDISNDGVTCDGDTCTRTDADGNTVELNDEEKATRRAAIEASEVAVEEGSEKAARAAVSDIENAATEGAKGVGNFLKIGGGLDIACQAYSSVRAVGYAAKTVRAVQLARYAMIFINTADQIKAGTAKPEDVAYLGGVLTSIAYDVKSGVKRKAAMDSAGMKYAMYGETSGFKGQGAAYVSQFMAGGGLAGDLIVVTDFINSTLGGSPKETCKVVSNGWVQAGSLIAGIALMLVPGVNVAVAASDVVKGALSVGASIGMAVLPELLKEIVAGTVTKDLVGEDSANAITSGYGVIASGTAQGGGNATMSVDEAAAYTVSNNEAIARYAKEEASALSPLDPSSKYTFVGSIVNKILPFVSSGTTISHTFSAFGSIVSSSLASMLPAVNAVSTEEYKTAYSSCKDPDYQELEIAADPFCNLVFGIPSKYLDRDPGAVSDSLAGQYDEETGSPISGSTYASYVTDCIDRIEPIGSGGIDDQGDDGSKCKINDSNANYYLFYMDQRIETGMDGYKSTSTSFLDEGADVVATTAFPTNELFAYDTISAKPNLTSALRNTFVTQGWQWSVA